MQMRIAFFFTFVEKHAILEPTAQQIVESEKHAILDNPNINKL